MSCCDTPGLMPVNAAITALLEQTHPVTTTEHVSLSDALHRITATDIVSPINVPSFANSAMDGYAVRIADLEQARNLPVAGKSMAGKPFQGPWPAQTCIRIMTGAVIPEGCDAVVMQEQTQVQGDIVTFTSLPKPQQNIRPVGDDIQKHALVLAKGSQLTVREMPLLASLGISQVDVVRKVKVAFFSTGDELRQVGEPLQAGQIYDSNRYTLRTWLSQMHCEPIDLGVIADDKTALKAGFFAAAQQADLIITSGGVSVGEADFTKEVLEEEGQINFWKLAIKPGKPFAFGRLQQTLFCGLPGNPVSALVTLHVLVQPLIAKLAGQQNWQAAPLLPAIAQSRFKKAPGRTDYQRAFYHVNADAQLVVETLDNQSSGAFSSMTKANCFAVLEQHRGAIEAGETVMIEPFTATLT